MSILVQKIWNSKVVWDISLIVISVLYGIISYLSSQKVLFNIQSLSLSSSFDLVEKTFSSRNIFHETQTFVAILSITLFVIAAAYLIILVLGTIRLPERETDSPQKKDFVSGKIRSPQTPGQSAQLSLKFANMQDIIRILLVLVIIILGWVLALLCSEVGTFSHQVFSQFSVQLLNFSATMLTLHYTSIFWWVMGFLLVPILTVFIAIHIHHCVPRDSIWDEKNMDEISHYSLTPLAKWDYILCLGLFILWETSPIFLGESSLNYQYIWTWDGSFSLWICVGIVLTFIIVTLLSWRNNERMVAIYSFIIGLVILSWIKTIVCGIDERHISTLVGILSSTILIACLTFNIRYYARFFVDRENEPSFLESV